MLGFGKSWEPIKDIPDLTGKVAIVTGGNAGIGAAIVEQLVAHGAKVYLGARSEERAKAAIKKIEDAHPEVKEKGLLVWLPLDLTEPSGVVKSAKSFMEKEERLDILINNAARLAASYELSPYGVELSIQINHVGHFVLVQQLMPVLKATAAQPGSDTRIIVMSSVGHTLCPKIAGFQNLSQFAKPFPGYDTDKGFYADCKRYFFSKLCNELFKLELQRRLQESCPNIIVLSAHPGFVATENSLTTWPWLLKPLVKPVMISTASGAHSALFASTAPEVRKEDPKYRAAYLDSDTSIKQSSAVARDKNLAADLWTLTQSVVDKALKGEGEG